MALLIKLDSKGPVLYRQERVGMDGRIFLFLKFRTMRTGADDRAHREYQRRYIEGRPDTNLGDSRRPVYKLHDDPRVTRIGSLASPHESRRAAAALKRPARRHERRGARARRFLTRWRRTRSGTASGST